MSDPFIAEIRIFGFNFAPRGWAFCNGQLLPISQNTALFSLIGTTYGGDGRTTTALPNLQGRFPIHTGNGPGLTPRNLGARGGSETVTLTTNQMPNHGHNLQAVGDEVADANNPGGNLYATADAGNAYVNSVSALVPMSPSMVSSVGGSEAHTNKQPYLTLNFCIALTGVYPSRS